MTELFKTDIGHTRRINFLVTGIDAYLHRPYTLLLDGHEMLDLN